MSPHIDPLLWQHGPVACRHHGTIEHVAWAIGAGQIHGHLQSADRVVIGR